MNALEGEAARTRFGIPILQKPAAMPDRIDMYGFLILASRISILRKEGYTEIVKLYGVKIELK